jgi:hypothetical protein
MALGSKYFEQTPVAKPHRHAERKTALLGRDIEKEPLINTEFP